MGILLDTRDGIKISCLYNGGQVIQLHLESCTNQKGTMAPLLLFTKIQSHKVTWQLKKYIAKKEGCRKVHFIPGSSPPQKTGPVSG